MESSIDLDIFFSLDYFKKILYKLFFINFLCIYYLYEDLIVIKKIREDI